MRSSTPQPLQDSANNFGYAPSNPFSRSRNLWPFGQAVHLPQVPLFLPLTSLPRLCSLFPATPGLTRHSTSLGPLVHFLAACSPILIALEVNHLETCHNSADLRRVALVLAPMVRRPVTLVLGLVRDH